MQDIAFGKKVRSNINKGSAKNINDGKSDTFWAGDFFPSYLDIDLGGIYEIHQIDFSVPENKTILFSLYASDNGRDYRKFYRLWDKNAFTNGIFSVELPVVFTEYLTERIGGGKPHSL